MNDLGTWQERILDKKPKQTNADRIRAMSDEELAGILTMQSVVSPPWCSENYDCPYAEQDPARCDLCALDWLRQEVNQNEGSDILNA